MRFLIDVETYSPVDLGAAGSWAYAQHRETDLRCAAWTNLEMQADTAVIHSWKPGDPPPRFGPNDTMEAWGDFDRLIWRFILTPRYGWQEMPDERWQNAMVRAAYGNLPMSLEKAAKVLATGMEKDMAGHRLMMRLSRPAKPLLSNTDPNRLCTPEALAALTEYCRQDVRAEAAASIKLPQLPASEQAVEAVDRKINARGVQIDLPLVQKLQDLALGYTEHLTRELEQITGGAVEKSTQLAQLADWLRGQGLDIPTGKGAMDKEAVGGYLKGLDPDCPAAQALRIRRELGKSSLSKLASLKAATGPDGRIRGTMQQYGAHQTGRWAGRIVQPQNLPKGVLDSEHMETYHLALDAVRSGDLDYVVALYGDQTMDVLASLIRCCFIPKQGYVLATADWNAIEPRVVAWMSQAKTLLATFAAGTDPYRVAAGMAYGITPDAVSKKQRNSVGKPQIIGCIGYRTKVLTKLGWRDMESVSTEDLVWNGERWAHFHGLIAKGRKVVMRLGESWLTPDHLVMTRCGWRPAMALVANLHIQRLRGGRVTAILRSLVPSSVSVMNVERPSDANADAGFLSDQISSLAAKLVIAGGVLRLSPASSEADLGDSSGISKILASCAAGEQLFSISASVATDRKILTIGTTGAEASVTDLALWISSLLISLRLRDGIIGASSSTALTSTEITHREIFALSHLWCLWQTAEMQETYDLHDVDGTHCFQIQNGLVHNCGYGMGVNKLADTFHLDLPLSQLCVDTFRKKLAPEVPQLWREVEQAAKLAISDRGSVRRASCLAFKADARNLYMRLPSGRLLWYRDCNFQEGKYGPEIHFMAENGMTHQWEDTHTWGGTLVENADQAISSCILRESLLGCEAAGLNPVMHVHDEILCEVREDTAAAAEKRLVDIMETVPTWAKGLPIAAKPDLRTFYVK